MATARRTRSASRATGARSATTKGSALWSTRVSAPACKSLEFHYQGIKQLAHDLGPWYELVRATVAHAVERYGLADVRPRNLPQPPPPTLPPEKGVSDV